MAPVWHQYGNLLASHVQLPAAVAAWTFGRVFLLRIEASGISRDLPQACFCNGFHKKDTGGIIFGIEELSVRRRHKLTQDTLRETCRISPF